VSETRFPIRFVSSGDNFNELEASYAAVDEEAAVSAETAAIRILLKKVRCNASDIWPEVFADGAAGWLLLSTPIAVDSGVLEELFGSSLFVYAGQKFRNAEGVLKAGCGFMVYVESAPSDVTLVGDRSNVQPIVNGWNLVGATMHGEELEEPNFIIRNGKYIRNDNDAAVGKGCWIFARGK